MSANIAKLIFYLFMLCGTIVEIGYSNNATHFFDDCPIAVFVSLGGLFYFGFKVLAKICQGLINGWGDGYDPYFENSDDCYHQRHHTPSATKRAGSPTYPTIFNSKNSTSNQLNTIAKTMNLKQNITIQEKEDGSKK